MVGIPKDIKQAIAYLDLAPGMRVVQFGAQRRGHIAHEIAKRVGEKGRVTIVDAIPEELQAINTFFASHAVHWVDVLRGDFAVRGGTSLKDKSADRLIVVHTAWRNPSHEVVLAEARRILKPGGKILFLDWQKSTKDPVGAHVTGHLDLLEAQRLCMQTGCERVERIVNNQRNWGFVMSFPVE